jgi:hypothetical protein
VNVNPKARTNPPRRRRRLFGIALALLALSLLTAALAFAERPVTVRAGNLMLTVNGSVTPVALPRDRLTPITLNIGGKIAEADGSHPPALKEVIVDTSKYGTVDARGVPTCKQAQLESRTSQEVEAACRSAIVGKGTTDVEVAFPEQAPIMLHSKLLAFNGGEKGATTTIYVHAFLTSPIVAAVVTTVKITKEQKGPYGTHSVASIPLIAGGAGSVTHFTLTFEKKLFTYKGKEHGYLLARCATGAFLASAEAIFRDATKVGPAKISRACTPKG